MLVVLAVALMVQQLPDAVDAHVHLSPTETERVRRLFDEAGIDWALNLSGGWPRGGFDAQMAAAKESTRWVVAVNLPWLAARNPRFPELAVELLELAAARGARALKIEKALGIAVRGPDGNRLPVDAPELDPVWTAAARLGLPVVIHTADPKAFWDPPTPANERWLELSVHPGWSYFDVPGVPSFETLLKELEHVVARHPDTVFVSVHFGNHAEDPASVEAQLERYPNLYIDIAARVVELGRFEPDRLARMFERHRHRILFGTDLGIWASGGVMLGSTGVTPDTDADVSSYYESHRRWLETLDSIPSPVPIQGDWNIIGLGLSEPTLDRIYRTNAEMLFGPPPRGAKASANYPPFFRDDLDEVPANRTSTASGTSA